MKKLFPGEAGLSPWLPLLILGALLCASCENLQNPESLRDFTFTSEEPAAGTGAVLSGARAGFFSAQGGSGVPVYTLVSGEGSGDNESFEVAGSDLIILTDLDERDYEFRARAEDGQGKFLEEQFTLTVLPPEGPGTNPPARVAGLAATPGMNRVYLSWNSAARAETYEVYYSTGTVFTGAEKFATEPTEPKVTVTGLEGSTVYNFWVVAKNQGGTGQASQMRASYKTGDPIDPYLYTDIVRWNSGADGYAFEMGADGELRINYGAYQVSIPDTGMRKVVYHVSFDPVQLNQDVPHTAIGHYTTNESLVTDVDGNPAAAGVFIFERPNAAASELYYATYYWGFKTQRPGYAVQSYFGDAWHVVNQSGDPTTSPTGAPSAGGYAATLQKAIEHYAPQDPKWKPWANFGWYIAFVSIPFVSVPK
jgi:hypothetical protein